MPCRDVVGAVQLSRCFPCVEKTRMCLFQEGEEVAQEQRICWFSGLHGEVNRMLQEKYLHGSRMYDSTRDNI